jgi:tetratricopeptide (TPR) repeat protein
MDEYQKMLDIRIESAKLMNDIKSKMENLEIIVGDVATEFISKKASDLVKKEVEERTTPVFEELKTRDEEMNKSIELMKKIEALDLTLTPSVYVERGGIYLDQGNIEKSIDNFNKAIEFSGDNFDAFFFRGLAYHRTYRFDEAIKDYERAKQINSKNIATYANIGVCYRVRKDHDYEKSIQNFNKAIELNPKYEFAYFQRGITYGDWKKYDLAINDLKQIETLNQKSPYFLDALFQIGFCYGEMGDFNSAIEYYLKRFDKGKHVSPALNLAEMYIYKKSFPDAEKWANESHALSGTDTDRIMSKFLLITTLILNNKEYKLELNSIVEKIKATPTFKVEGWSFEGLLGCLADQSVPIEKTELVKKLIALLKKEIKPEEILLA